MIRIGHGYDVHAFSENRKCIIGGVTIPYEKGLLGHSDADVLLHAISDSLLGAAALGDIGKHSGRFTLCDYSKKIKYTNKKVYVHLVISKKDMVALNNKI